MLHRHISIETAIDRITDAEADADLSDDDREQQHEVYEKTFRALADVTPDDNDEGVTVVSKWIADQIRSNEKRPTSRAVRRRGRKYCQENGYDVSNNDWLGI